MKKVDEIKHIWLNSLVGSCFVCLYLPDPFLGEWRRIQCINLVQCTNKISETSAVAD